MENKVDEFLKAISELEKALDPLLGKLHKKPEIRLRQRNRIFASTQDIIIFSRIFRNIFEREVEHSKKELVKPKILHTPRRRAHIFETINLSQELGCSFKVMFYFIRSFQDSCYSVLHEAYYGPFDESRSENHASEWSMSNAYKKPQSDIHKKIREAIPNYFEWFNSIREVRNRIKQGTGHTVGFTAWRGKITEMSVKFQKINEINSPGTIDLDDNLTTDDITKSINMSSKLLELITTELK